MRPACLINPAVSIISISLILFFLPARQGSMMRISRAPFFPTSQAAQHISIRGVFRSWLAVGRCEHQPYPVIVIAASQASIMTSSHVLFAARRASIMSISCVLVFPTGRAGQRHDEDVRQFCISAVAAVPAITVGVSSQVHTPDKQHNGFHPVQFQADRTRYNPKSLPGTLLALLGKLRRPPASQVNSTNNQNTNDGNISHSNKNHS